MGQACWGGTGATLGGGADLACGLPTHAHTCAYTCMSVDTHAPAHTHMNIYTHTQKNSIAD